jgi:hypothetical protein
VSGAPLDPLFSGFNLTQAPVQKIVLTVSTAS